MEPSEIITIFESQHPEWGPRLRKLYHIVSDRPTASTSGALDFVNDARYAVPAETIAAKLTARGQKAYRYVVDEKNPWQASARSHHAVDLLFLFGTVDLSPYPEAEAVGQEMRHRWIKFIHGEEPWAPISTGKRFAFGPYGESKEIDQRQFGARRRVAQMKLLMEAGFDVYGPIMNKLTAGKISLLN
jgi:carboxylesterase type B